MSKSSMTYNSISSLLLGKKLSDRKGKFFQRPKIDILKSSPDRSAVKTQSYGVKLSPNIDEEEYENNLHCRGVVNCYFKDDIYCVMINFRCLKVKKKQESISLHEHKTHPD